MRSIKQGIQMRPQSNAAEAEVQHLEAKPRLALVPQPEVVRRWAADHRWAFVIAVLVGVFAVTLVTYVLFPSLGTLAGNSVETWSQQGP